MRSYCESLPWSWQNHHNPNHNPPFAYYYYHNTYLFIIPPVLYTILPYNSSTSWKGWNSTNNVQILQHSLASHSWPLTHPHKACIPYACRTTPQTRATLQARRLLSIEIFEDSWGSDLAWKSKQRFALKSSAGDYWRIGGGVGGVGKADEWQSIQQWGGD